MAERITDSYESDSPYINAAVWPWAVAGWCLAAMFLASFLVARILA